MMLRAYMAALLIFSAWLSGCASADGGKNAYQGASASGHDEIDARDLYTYRATITGVYDGDTVTADIDLGFHIWIRGEKLRLSRIDAPEVRGEERPQGLISRDWLREKIDGKKVIIKTLKSKTSDYDQKGKYGRYLAEIYLDGENINDALVENGLAKYREY